MKKMVRLVCLALVSSSIVDAQTSGQWEKIYSALLAQDIQNAHGYSNVGFSPAIMSVTNNPFTATRTYTDQRMENGQNVGDPLTAECTIARDDKGRIHYEMAFESVENGKVVIGGFDVEIYDPVAHTTIRYFAKPDHSLPPEPVAEVRKLKLMSELQRPIPPSPKAQSPDAGNGPPASPDSISAIEQPPSPQEPDAAKKAPVAPIKFIPTKDNLPAQYVNGYAAVIHRTILKYGDKEQYFQIQEDWFSPDYAIDLRNLQLRETLNKETIETKDIVQGAPDPELFEIPSGYRVRIEKAGEVLP